MFGIVVAVASFGFLNPVSLPDFGQMWRLLWKRLRPLGQWALQQQDWEHIAHFVQYMAVVLVVGLAVVVPSVRLVVQREKH
jgi:hypothetical protein